MLELKSGKAAGIAVSSKLKDDQIVAKVVVKAAVTGSYRVGLMLLEDNIVANEITAPIKVGDIVGKLNVYEDGGFKYSVDLTIENDVDKANIFMVFIRNLKDIISINL